MTSAALIALLSVPALWTATNTTPLTICDALDAVCLVQSPTELLLTERDAGLVRITPLAGPVAAVARNLVVLRMADAMGLARDRAAQGMRERAGRYAEAAQDRMEAAE